MLRGGRVTVNGRTVRKAEARADPFRDQVALDGQVLDVNNACRYLVLNKPYGVLCAFTDPERRPTLADYIDVPAVYAAGRLDLDSEGLLLLTSDGWLVHRLTHPRFHLPKVYWLQVERMPDSEALDSLRRGVMVKGRRTAPADVEILPAPPALPPRSVPIRYRKSVPTAWLQLTLIEGRKRQARRMTAAVGYPTLRLVRVSIGPLELGALAPGEWRDLTPSELQALRSMMGDRARQRRRR
jgi:23S rRNA pseudouridine2457 synthase